MADAVACARESQTTPDGFSDLAGMLRGALERGGEVAGCGTCTDARGLRDADLLEGVRRGSMEQLGRWVAEAEKVVTF